MVDSFLLFLISNDIILIEEILHAHNDEPNINKKSYKSIMHKSELIL